MKKSNKGANASKKNKPDDKPNIEKKTTQQNLINATKPLVAKNSEKQKILPNSQNSADKEILDKKLSDKIPNTKKRVDKGSKSNKNTSDKRTDKNYNARLFTLVFAIVCVVCIINYKLYSRESIVLKKDDFSNRKINENEKLSSEIKDLKKVILDNGSLAGKLNEKELLIESLENENSLLKSKINEQKNHVSYLENEMTTILALKDMEQAKSTDDIKNSLKLFNPKKPNLVELKKNILEFLDDGYKTPSEIAEDLSKVTFNDNGKLSDELADDTPEGRKLWKKISNFPNSFIVVQDKKEIELKKLQINKVREASLLLSKGEVGLAEDLILEIDKKNLEQKDSILQSIDKNRDFMNLLKHLNEELHIN